MITNTEKCVLYIAISRKVNEVFGDYTFKVGISSDLEVRTGSMNGRTFEKQPLLQATDWELVRIKELPDRATAEKVERSIFSEFDNFGRFFVKLPTSPVLQGSGKTEVYRIDPESKTDFIKKQYSSSNQEFKDVFRKFREAFGLVSSERLPERPKHIRTFRDSNHRY